MKLKKRKAKIFVFIVKGLHKGKKEKGNGKRLGDREGGKKSVSGGLVEVQFIIFVCSRNIPF